MQDCDAALPAGARQAMALSRVLRGTETVRQAALTSLEEEMAYGMPFLYIPVCMACGAVTYFKISGEPRFGAIGLGMVVAGTVCRLARNRPVLRLAVASVLLFLAGMLAGKFETWRTGTKMLGSPVTTRMTGIVRTLEYANDGRVRLTIDVTDTHNPNLRYQPDRVSVTARNIPSDMRPGAGIAGLVRLFPARGPLTPGGYDFGFENYFSGIGANGFFLGNPRIAKPSRGAGIGLRFQALIENFRLAIYGRVRTVLPGEDGEIAAALATGLKRGISADTNEALRRTGLAHILSISGLHMALVAGTIMAVLRLCFAAFPDFAVRHPVRKYAAATALLAGFAYLLLSGGGVATVRSFMMLAIMLVALICDRAAITLRNLAVAAIMIIAISPHEVAGPSFQMSFAATSALVAAYRAWTAFRAQRRAAADPVHARGLASLLAIVVRYAGGLALTSLVAGAATAIFAAYHFHRIAPLGLPANLVAMPVFSTLVMPPAVLALVLIPFDLEAPALHVMGYGISIVTAIAAWFAERTAGDVIGMVPPAAVALMTVTLVILVTATTKLRYAALPFAIAAAISITHRRLPDIIVSEDARLVAVRTANGDLAFNRARPNQFIADDWRKASMTANWVGPVPGKSRRAPVPSSRFLCSRGLCLAKTMQGVSVAYVSQEGRLEDACKKSGIVIISDPTIKAACEADGHMVVTARHLALLGTVFLYVGENRTVNAQAPPRAEAGYGNAQTTSPLLGATPGQVTVHQALSSIERPWHRERAYSRHARGLRDLN